MSSHRPHPQRQRRRKQRHEDTVVAYHEYLQALIRDRLNAVNLGPAKVPFRIAMVLYIWGLACCIVGILVISLRHRHLYLTGVWTRFVGPLFIIFFLLSFGAATYFLNRAKQISNKYRRDLRFQPLGQYGVKVVHITRLPHEKILREEYKTGSTPHVTAKAPRQMRSYPHSGQGDYGREYGREYGHEYGSKGYGREYGSSQAGYGQRHREPRPAGPPDVIPGRPRQYKSRVVIQQDQPPRSHRGHPPEDDSSV
ncbi:uncharacterized protein LOC135471218 isoform X2 [Liolophura sinensis]|uniref:uncharacterized protein LOC135471218 isoform X2 n=1 Tax=Liolophura sinensis TaxID=3198878 RepID=UPI00315918E8